MKIPKLEEKWLESDGDIVSLLLLKAHVEKAEKLLAKLEAIPDPLMELIEVERETIVLFNKYKGDMLSPVLSIKVKALKQKRDKLIKESENYDVCSTSETVAQLKGYISSMKTKLANLQWHRSNKDKDRSEKVDKTLQASQYMIDFIQRGF